MGQVLHGCATPTHAVRAAIQRSKAPLDDCLHALQVAIPHLTRSSLHRLFQRHDISSLPIETEKKAFKAYIERYGAPAC